MIPAIVGAIAIAILDHYWTKKRIELARLQGYREGVEARDRLMVAIVEAVERASEAESVMVDVECGCELCRVERWAVN